MAYDLLFFCLRRAAAAAEVIRDASRALLLRQLERAAHDRPDVLERLDLRDTKLDAEAHLDGDDEVDVGERIPSRHVGPLRLHGQRQRLIPQQVAENLAERGQRLLFVHVSYSA